MTVDRVRQILGEERARRWLIRQGVPEAEIDVSGAPPLAKVTVQTYLYRARKPGELRQFTQMQAEGRAFPAPVYHSTGTDRPGYSGDVPVWPIREGETREQVEQQFRVWYRNRAQQGSGGGRPAGWKPKPKPADVTTTRAARRRRRKEADDG